MIFWFVDGYLLKKAEKVRESGRNEVIKTWSRRSTILPQFVGLICGVDPATPREGRRFSDCKPLSYVTKEVTVA